MDKERAIAGVDLSAHGRIGRHSARSYLSTKFRPIQWEEDITIREDVFLTMGYLVLRYKRSVFKNIRARFQLISRDGPFLGVSGIRLYDWDDFLHVCEKDWRFDWIRRATNISPEYFDIARMNYGVYVPIGIDFVKYSKECGGFTRFTTEAVLERAKAEAAKYRRSKQDEEPDDDADPNPDMEDER